MKNRGVAFGAADVIENKQVDRGFAAGRVLCPKARGKKPKAKRQRRWQRKKQEEEEEVEEEENGERPRKEHLRGTKIEEEGGSSRKLEPRVITRGEFETAER